MSRSPKIMTLTFVCGLLTTTSAFALERTALQLAQANVEDEQRQGRENGDASPARDDARESAPKSEPKSERGEDRRSRERTDGDGDAPKKRAVQENDAPPKAERVPKSDDAPRPAEKRQEPAQKVVPRPADTDDGPDLKTAPPKAAPVDEAVEPKAKPAPVPKAEPKPEPKAEPKEDLKELPGKDEPKATLPERKAPEPAGRDAAPKAEKQDAPPKESEPKASDTKDVPKTPEPKDGGADKKALEKDAMPAAPAPAPRERAEDGKQTEAAPPEVKDLKELKEERKERVEDGGKRVIIEEPDKRAIIKEEGRTIIRHDETERFRRLDRGGFRREKRNGLDISISVRPGGIEIYTESDERGRPLRRYRRDRDGREVILFDNRDFYSRHRDGSFIDAIVDLPPPRISIPREDYIVDYDEASDVEIYEALSAPPVVEIDRTYSLEEVRRSPMLRDRMRRVDLDTINFEFGAFDVGSDQYPALERVARAMKRVIERNPDEMFLVEGHTDAVGSDEDNLSLSDRRAESVSIILTEEFGVPPENMTTQGYGEQYLKVSTQAAERENRRVAVRRITPLLSRK